VRKIRYIPQLRVHVKMWFTLQAIAIIIQAFELIQVHVRAVPFITVKTEARLNKLFTTGYSLHSEVKSYSTQLVTDLNNSYQTQKFHHSEHTSLISFMHDIQSVSRFC
jgi:hypothetical protein